MLELELTLEFELKLALEFKRQLLLYRILFGTFRSDVTFKLLLFLLRISSWYSFGNITCPFTSNCSLAAN